MASLPKLTKLRKNRSFSLTEQLDCSRTLPTTDSLLFGLVKIVHLDDICLRSLTCLALLPDNSKRELEVNRFLTIKDVIREVCEEYKLECPQVKLCSNNSMLSLDADATLLDNQEIIIEDTVKESKNMKHEDDRLALLKMILDEEEKYLESLRILVDVYGKNLRNGLNHLDHGIIFERVKPIQEATSSLVVKLKDLYENWMPSLCIATAFDELPALLWRYDDYFARLTMSKRILRQKYKYDSDFLTMVNEVKLTAKHSLGLLILLPARRLSMYQIFITALLGSTPDDHDDHRRLKVLKEKLQQILSNRKEEIEKVENEFRLIEVQDRFPYDDLGLDEGLSNIQRLKNLLNSRRKSAPAAAFKAAFGKVNKSVPSIDVSLAIHSEHTQETSQRKYILINEGMVQLTAGTLSHDRYLFLFNDFLLVAKCKSTSHFKLKDRVKLCEMWIADCVDDVADNVKFRDKSFVIGWPIENVVATFSSMEEKTKWKEDLMSNIALQKASLDFQTTLIKIHYKDNDTAQTVSKSISVGKTDDANKVVQMSMDLFNILNKENACDYQLWVMNKDGSYPLIGHEFPFAIQMSQYREVSIVDDDDYVPSSPDSPPVRNTPSIEITPENQLQFILQKGRKVHQKVSLNRLVQLGKKKKGSKRWRKFSSTQDETSSTGKVFGKPLDQLSSEEQPIPKTINDLLVRLFRFGPSTIGVFRKTANQREVKELREEMDEGKEISFDDTSIHVLAALLKDFLRNIPNALYCSEHYEELLSTNDVTEESARIDKIISLVKKLPTPNFELTKRFFCVLYHISRNCEQNNMTPFNLGVCVAQSILKPANSTRIEYAEQAKSSAPQLVEFIIDNFPVIFGKAAMTILGDVSEIIVDTADSLSNGDTKVSEISGGSKSLRHSDSSLYKSVTTEEQKNSDWMLLTVKDNSGNLSKSNPNSPVLQRKPSKAVDSKDTSKKIHSAFYHPKFSPRSLRRSLRKVTRSNSKNHRDLELSGKDSLRREKAVKLTKKATNTEPIEQNAHSKTTLSSSSRLSPTVPEPAQIRRSYAPKRDRVMLASSQSIYNAPPNYAERVHSIHDRRRQPAAPSYQEHMQRTSIRRGHNVGTPNGTLRSQLRNNHKGYESGDGRHGTATKVGLELNCDFNSQDGFRSSQDLSPDPLGPSSNASGGIRLIPKKSTGSETSMSSLSSCDDGIDVVDTNKLQLTRLRHIRNFRDIPGYTSLLSPSDQITKTDETWGHVSQDVNVEISDYQRMKMAEETYV